MFGKWKKIFEGTVGGRWVAVEQYYDGTFKVLTKSNVDDTRIPRVADGDGSGNKQSLILSPQYVGQPLEGEGASINDACKELEFDDELIAALLTAMKSSNNPG